MCEVGPTSKEERHEVGCDEQRDFSKAYICAVPIPFFIDNKEQGLCIGDRFKSSPNNNNTTE